MFYVGFFCFKYTLSRVAFFLMKWHAALVRVWEKKKPPTEMLTPILQQEDVRNFIDSSLKHGYHLSIFRKERIGGDSHGISYWWAYSNFIQIVFFVIWGISTQLFSYCTTGMKMTQSSGIGCIVKLDVWSVWRSQQKNLKEREFLLFRLSPITGRL